MTEPVLIVGAGHAGTEAAFALRKDGFAGPVMLISREAWLPYERPPLSKKLLLGEAGPDRIRFRNPEAYAKAGIELLLGVSATVLEPAVGHLTMSDGRGLAFGHCILATGAGARRLPLPGMDLRGVHALRDLDHALGFQAALQPGARIVVIGGGYLGLEAAAAARQRGALVTVVEAAPGLLGRSLSPVTAGAIAARHRAAGVELRLGAAVETLLGERQVRGVALRDGEVLPADAVLVAIGAVPEMELAARAGLRCQDGILVDALCRTSAPNVFAIGDVASYADPVLGRIRLEAVQVAAQQARMVAAEITGKPQPPSRLPYFWTEQFGAKLQIAGIPRPGMPCEDEVVGDLAADFAVYRRQQGILVAVEALNRPADFVRSQALIGKPRTA